ncbi:MAG: DUF2283 domain-containing protein [Candidatus Methanoperedens sp.]|jgi:uncharacterized protein YuzE
MKKITYDKDADALIIIVSDKKLGYEEEIDDFIVGFSEDNEPIWLEILDVSKRFIPDIMNKIAQSSAGESIAQAA